MEILLLIIVLVVDLSLILMIFLYRKRRKKFSIKNTKVRPYQMINHGICKIILYALDKNIGGLTEYGLISYFEREGFNLSNQEIKQNVIYLQMIERVGCEVENRWNEKTISYKKISIYYNKETAHRIFDY